MKASPAELGGLLFVLVGRSLTGSTTHSPALANSLAAARTLPRELRCIVARAMAPDPADRYQSVVELSADIERYLEHKPVAAMPATRFYVVRKFLWRHRVAASFVGLVSLSLIGGLAASLTQMFEAQAQRDRAEIEAERAQTALDFLTTMLDQIDPNLAQGADTTLLRQMLDAAAPRAEHELSDKPEIEGLIQFVIARTYQAIAEWQTAMAHYRRAAEIAAATDDMRTYIAASKNLVLLPVLYGDGAAAPDAFDELIELGHQHLGQGHYHVIDMLRIKADMYNYVNQPEPALATVEQALSRLGDQWSEGMDSVVIDLFLAKSGAHSALGNIEAAERAALEAYELARHSEAVEAPRQLTIVRHVRARNLLEQQRFAEAEPLLREIVTDMEAIHGEDGYAVLFPLANLASAIREQGKVEQAIPYFDRVMELAREYFDEDSNTFLSLNYNYGNMLRELGRVEEAVMVHRQVIADALRGEDGDHPSASLFHMGAGLSELRAGHYDRAAQLLERAVTELSELRGSSHHRTIEAAEGLAEALTALDREQEAEDETFH